MLSHYRYFDKRFTEMFLEWPSTKHIIFVQMFGFTDCHGNRTTERLFFQTILKKINCSETIRGMKLRTFAELFIALVSTQMRQTTDRYLFFLSFQKVSTNSNQTFISTLNKYKVLHKAQSGFCKKHSRNTVSS